MKCLEQVRLGTRNDRLDLFISELGSVVLLESLSSRTNLQVPVLV